MLRTYKLTWESVSSIEYPSLYVGPKLGNQRVPDEYWHKTEKITNDPFDQYNTLKRWSETDEEYIRNVRLYEGEQPEIQWREYEG